MCLGIPARIVELHGENGHLATADVLGVKRQINVGLLEEAVQPGDWVLLHVGFAVNRLSEEELELVNASLQMMGRASEDDALASLEAELEQRSRRRTEQEEVEQWA
jgi:hydrogenase expression/formation protein HypC